MKHCISEIKSCYQQLTKKEKQLADYILKNFEAVATMPTSVLAKNAGVVNSVIVRFCQTLGFTGYTEFKLALSRETERNERLNYIPYISTSDTGDIILDKIFAANIKTLYDTAEAIDKTILSDAVSALSTAENIYIYGIGTSAGIVCDFQYRLMQLGFKAFAFTDAANMKVSTLNIEKNDVALGISNSGRTIATFDALSLAKENGAKTICLTSCKGSQITTISDFPLVIKTDEIDYPIEAISARIAHISVLDAIAVSLSALKFDVSSERMAKSKDLIDTIRY